jgi:hypothetical protein
MLPGVTPWGGAVRHSLEPDPQPISIVPHSCTGNLIFSTLLSSVPFSGTKITKAPARSLEGARVVTGGNVVRI